MTRYAQEVGIGVDKISDTNWRIYFDPSLYRMERADFEKARQLVLKEARNGAVSIRLIDPLSIIEININPLLCRSGEDHIAERTLKSYIESHKIIRD